MTFMAKQFLQGLFSNTDEAVESLGYFSPINYLGSPLFDCDRAISGIIQSSQLLQDESLHSASLIQWLFGVDDISHSLYSIGLKKEARQIQEFTCRVRTGLGAAAHTGISIRVGKANKVDPGQKRLEVGIRG